MHKKKSDTIKKRKQQKAYHVMVFLLMSTPSKVKVTLRATLLKVSQVQRVIHTTLRAACPWEAGAGFPPLLCHLLVVGLWASWQPS